MTRTTNARLAGFAFLLYIAAGVSKHAMRAEGADQFGRASSPDRQEPGASIRWYINESRRRRGEVDSLGLRLALATERFLPVGKLPGISLVARAVKR